MVYFAQFRSCGHLIPRVRTGPGHPAGRTPLVASGRSLSCSVQPDEGLAGGADGPQPTVARSPYPSVRIGAASHAGATGSVYSRPGECHSRALSGSSECHYARRRYWTSRPSVTRRTVIRMDRNPPRTLLEQIVRGSRRTIEENCAAFEKTARHHGENAALSPRQLSRWIAGQVGDARPVAQRVAALHWGYAFELLIGPPLDAVDLSFPSAGPVPGTSERADGMTVMPWVDQVELLRQSLHDGISTGAMTTASLDDWELTARGHGQATRFRPAGVLLLELTADIADLQRALARRQTSSSLRRLTRVTAQMAGLMFLTLIELDERPAARSWARTARVAADEAGDPTISAWVRAQEAYVHYYSGDLVEAVAVARHAQALAGRTICAGLPLAAALEARAHAALGHEPEARVALDRAGTAVDQLDPDVLVPSAFGYNEAQLRFHEGNALTHLHDTTAARVAADRALALYPPSDYLDRTLVQLDQATCLTYDGDVPTGLAQATTAVMRLTDQQRTGMILARARDVLGHLPRRYRALPAAREFRDLLMLINRPEGDPS